MYKIVLLLLLLLFQPSCFLLTVTGMAVGGTVKTIGYGVSGVANTAGAVSGAVASSAKKSEHRVAKVLGDGTWVAEEPYNVKVMWEETRAGFKEFQFTKVSGSFKSAEGTLTGVNRFGVRVDVQFQGVGESTIISILWGENGNEEMSKKMLDILAMRLDRIEKLKQQY